MDLDLRGLSHEIKCSALRLAAYTDENDPPASDAEWVALPGAIGVPVEHLVVLLARISGKSELVMRLMLEAPARVH